MGWILDGFPSTYQQAKLLEKALTGMDVGDRKTGKSRKSNLAPDPRPTPPLPEPGSGINVVVLFDVDNDLALRRSAGRTCEWNFFRFTGCPLHRENRENGEKNPCQGKHMEFGNFA